MSVTLQRLDQAEVSELPVTIRNGGIAGAGGAGFPTHAKWDHLDSVDWLLVNHQESEPNYYIDKWLGREYAEEFAAFFDALLDSVLDVVVVGAKAKDREAWLDDLESATDGTVYMPEDLPLDPEEESGVVFAYTDDQYEYGMESVLLRMTAGTVIGQDLPMDHGWIVQNTETLFNVYRSLRDGDPMTRKFVHVDGNTPQHRFLEVPVGTPATALLEAAGRPVDDLGEDEVLADGGPGWCFEIEPEPHEFGVRKRTNCLLVLDREDVENNTLGEGRINVLNPLDWDRPSEETEPNATLLPDYVRVPLIANPDFEGVVAPSRPIVEPGDEVSRSEMIATPGTDGVSNAQHAPIEGEVVDVTDSHVEIRATREAADATRGVYWTRCVECGSYVPAPEMTGDVDVRSYVCAECR